MALDHSPSHEKHVNRALSPSALLRRCGLTVAALVVAYFAIPVHVPDSTIVLVTQVVFTLLAFIAVIVGIEKQFKRHFHEPDAPVGGLIVGVVAGLLLFALIDYALAFHTSTEFVGLETRLDALYFAISTLLTVGFGDISAQGQLARGVLCAQMLFNVVVITSSASMLMRELRGRARASR